jgi:hypothetical protein
MFTELDSFTVTSWDTNGDTLVIVADGELTVSASDPQETVTWPIFGATFEVEMSDIESLPSSLAEAAALVPPCAEWEVITDDD